MQRYLLKLNSTKPFAQQIIFTLCAFFLFALPVIPALPNYLPRILLSLLILFSLVALDKLNTGLLIFAGLAIFIGWISHIYTYVFLEYLTEFSTNVFLFWIVGIGIQRMMRLKEVFLSNLFEAINGFLLLAIAFTSLTVVLQKHFPLSYVSDHPVLGGQDLIYYTIVTLTTTGYGDILPNTPAAKDLAAIMAISGQFYVAVIMAIMVGKYSNQNK
jgi:voltage-gated potassium channel Kch